MGVVLPGPNSVLVVVGKYVPVVLTLPALMMMGVPLLHDGATHRDKDRLLVVVDGCVGAPQSLLVGHRLGAPRIEKVGDWSGSRHRELLVDSSHNSVGANC